MPASRDEATTLKKTPVKHILSALAAAAALASSLGLARAQDIKIANIVELSGPGTTSGTMFKNGGEMAGPPTQIVAEISTASRQVEFFLAPIQAKPSGADAIFACTNEEVSVRLLRGLRRQGWSQPIIGETVLTSSKVVELAGDAADGAVAHVGLTVKAPVLQAWGKSTQTVYNSVSDHNGVEGDTAVYILKASIERVGKLDRESFMTEVRCGQVVVAETLPALRKKLSV